MSLSQQYFGCCPHPPLHLHIFEMAYWTDQGLVYLSFYFILWNAQLPVPVAAQFQWVECAGSPGESGTGVCVLVALPVALQWYSQWYSHLAVGSSLRYWWNSPNWIDGFVNAILMSFTSVFSWILNISCLKHVILRYEINTNPALRNLLYQPILHYQWCNIPCPWAHF